MNKLVENIEPYIRLSAAIVNSGIEDNDTYFLNSEWGKFLIDTVIEYNNQQDNKCMGVTLSLTGGSSGKDL